MADARPSEDAIRQALRDFPDPETGRSIVQLDQLRRVHTEGGRVAIEVGLTTFSAPLWEETRRELVAFVRERFPSLEEVDVHVVRHERPAEKIGEIGLTAKGVVAVGSGKGGVGKSTIAASIAFGLKNAGCKVGLLDADVYGPSIPHLLGVDERPQAVERKLQPVIADDLRVMSMGFLVPPGEAVVWRGPMLHGAITQFLRDTEWGDLDYLIIDMPPGTGDIALTLSQLLPLSGAVVVCTPQDVALLDAVKAIAMFRKVHIEVLGLVENMSFFECPGCGGRYEIFGSGGAKRRAEALDVPFLGELPINIQLRIRGDEGRTAANFEDPIVSNYLHTICLNLVKNIAAGRKEQPALPTLSVL
jgi:ATP-binding protein involved in chromosome partitioning